MWPRKQLDIGWTDLAFGLGQVVASRARPAARTVVGLGWVSPSEAIVSLSVRTGWDLLLTALELPAGSEVITSAVTIPDMVRIIEHHGLVAVPVDVDVARLDVDIEQLERLITPRTRAILVAHLFGSRMDLASIVELAKRHDLLVIEDCAQAFVGREYAGHSDADCSLFSFGPIKTTTALGGAVVRVRDKGLRERMEELQRRYPVQGRGSYLRRLAKYAGFRVLCKPVVYGFAARLMGALGVDYDETLANAARSFGASEFFTQIRRQPCVPLVRMLERRIATFERWGVARLRRRTMRGDELSRALPAGMVVGEQNSTHTCWVFPMRVGNGAEVLIAMRRAGFDATTRSSLIVVPNKNGSPVDDAPLAPWLREIVFLPGGEDIPDRDWQRLISIMQDVACAAESSSTRELVAMSRVSVTS